MNKKELSKEALLYLEGNSLPEVSAATGIKISTLYFRLNKLGLLRSRTEGVQIAGKKGRLGGGMRGKRRTMTKEWRQKIIESRRKNAKGTSLKPSGYVEITVGPNKGRGLHVVRMEEHIGRKLKKNECVHHRDHNRSNNDIENLELMTISEHARHHALERIHHRERDNLGRLK